MGRRKCGERPSCADPSGSRWCLLDVGIDVSDGVAHPDARLGGSASDLWLGLSGRTTTMPLTRLGEEPVLERFEAALGTIRDAM